MPRSSDGPPTPPRGTATAGLVAGDPADERIAALTLQRSRLYPGQKLTAAIDAYGSAVELALSHVRGEVPTEGLDHRAIDRAGGDIAEWGRRGYRLLVTTETRYPAILRGVHDRPPLLWIEGNEASVIDGRTIAVVGTREASKEGMQRARRIARAAGRAGLVVASGLARGIDASAHTGALEVGGRTIAVMGTGLGRVYPREHQELAAEILRRSGAHVSQFEPGRGPQRWTFPERNKTMSGLSLATVVIEAGPTSGARMQAEAALRHGRPVLLPSSLVNSHEWASEMVRTGFHGVRATEVESADDIVEMFLNDAADDAGAIFV